MSGHASYDVVSPSVGTATGATARRVSGGRRAGKARRQAVKRIDISAQQADFERLMLERGFDMTAIRETKIAVRELDARKCQKFRYASLALWEHYLIHGWSLHALLVWTQEKGRYEKARKDKEPNYVIPARYVPTLQDPRLNSFIQPFVWITQELEKIVRSDDDDDDDDTLPPPAPNLDSNDEQREEQ
ncbi:hypothetical protein HYFRA_00003250 [Hymenoscyphus fraxineus]|uniref:Uncharacterized protein n=1 Tax=Hymenoscyphus fraxineus TaxID=746836 RepID=A0A9N9KU00_9HELO|nr:hypothetical protein HYFRA_00003250 [Hymenoscyphus fraxineus]